MKRNVLLNELNGRKCLYARTPEGVDNGTTNASTISRRFLVPKRNRCQAYRQPDTYPILSNVVFIIKLKKTIELPGIEPR